MSKTRKNRKHTRKTYRKRRVFKKTTISPTRADIMRGGSGVSFPASMNNNVVTPQSFLPFNNMSNDPNYSVIASRNTGPFLTGMKGGNRSRRIKGGTVINAINNSQPINDIPGASNIIAGFSGNQSIFSSTPMRISPLA